MKWRLSDRLKQRLSVDLRLALAEAVYLVTLWLLIEVVFVWLPEPLTLLALSGWGFATLTIRPLWTFYYRLLLPEGLP